MITRLEERGITIEEVKISEKKVKSIQEKLQALAWRDVEIKYLAQRVRMVAVIWFGVADNGDDHSRPSFLTFARYTSRKTKKSSGLMGLASI